jgi:hypothetical protein
MYFPYLRGKQNEILALRELAPALAGARSVTAILEPARKGTNGSGLKQITQIAASGVPIIIIENPEKGDFQSDHTPIRELFAGPLKLLPAVMVGFIVDSRTSASRVRDFMARHAERRIVFLHFGSVPDPQDLAALQERRGNTAYNVFLEGRGSRSYMTSFKHAAPILLEDFFVRQVKNESYPAREFFTDFHKRHRVEGFAGFGDFLMVGNQYAESGGAAYAVAIHLTNREQADEIWIRHFVSDRTKGTADTPGKFLEALRKAVRFIRSSENWRMTEGCREFIALEKNQHFPGLGFVKKISMKHHMELMAGVLAEPS